MVVAAASVRAAPDLVMVATDGQHLALMPSAGLFFVGGVVTVEPIYLTRVDDVAVELVSIDRKTRTWVDVLRLTRLMPIVLNELIQMIGWERTLAVLEHRVEAKKDVTRIAARHGILARNAVVPAGWLEGMNDGPLHSLPDPDELPDLLRLRMYFPDANIELIGTKQAFLERVERRLASPREPVTHEPCFIALVRGERISGHAVSYADLDPSAVDVMQDFMPADERSIFESILTEQTSAENADTIECKRLESWRPDELGEVLATAQAMSLKSHKDTLAFLDRVLDLNIEVERLAPDLTPTLVQLLNLWAMLLRRVGNAERSLKLIDLALACEPDDDLRQELLTSRAFTHLQATQRVVVTSSDQCCDRAAFPTLGSRQAVEAWSRAADDYAEALALDANDALAWAQLGIAALLLGTAVANAPIRRRLTRLREAAHAFDRALSVGGLLHSDQVRCNRDACLAAIEQINQLPWYRRAFGRYDVLSSDELSNSAASAKLKPRRRQDSSEGR